MAKPTDQHDEHWGEQTARLTFLLTIVGTALFVGVVFLFILM